MVRCIDDLGRVVIPKEIRRTMRIREGDSSLTTLTPSDSFCVAIHSVVERYKK
ncbi:MAG: stage V sporulation protein T [Clostridia bacterium]|nr:stage V sporulation protein T [Clostridia bacterium]